MAAPFVHLHVHSHFSMLDGACRIEELVAAAQAAGMPALALTDHNGLYGAVRFYQAAHRAGIKPILGVELEVEGGYHLVLLAEDRRGYANLCRLITRAHLTRSRGQPQASLADLRRYRAHLVALSGCARGEVPARLAAGDRPGALAAARRYAGIYGPGHFFIELTREHPQDRREAVFVSRLAALAAELGLPIVATNNVHYPTPDRASLQDLLVCVQTLTTVHDRHQRRRHGHQCYFKTPAQMAALFRGYPQAVANSAAIAARCHVNLGLGELHFPYFPVPPGFTTRSYLEHLCRQAIPRKYPPAGRAAACARLEHELGVIRHLQFEEYFLVVWDIVRYARSQGIRCAGRGSAADAIVSYLLDITCADPIAAHLLFARFAHRERRSMPDIDLDFDSRRRDEVMEYVYQKYGPNHTAMVATINTYHARSALREFGKALGLPLEVIGRVSKSFPHLRASAIRPALQSLPELQGQGLDSGQLSPLYDFCQAADGYPRHLSVHLGGMIISRQPITDLVPLERSAKGIVVAQYDKDDVEALGLVKMDLLGLRNLSAIEEACRLVQEGRGLNLDLEALPLDDEATYRLLRSTQTVGVFQLESPGMRGLLRGLQPTHFEDIIANISLFRPGPMQADMIGPFLARRHGREPVRYPHPCLEPVLRGTYGVILYQEQVLEVASAVAGFTLGQADLLRRAMTKDRSPQEMERLRQGFMQGAQARGLTQVQAAEIFRQLSAFAAYGFCKAHAACFGHLAYQTAYLKAHYPAEFLAAILSNQPMGFYPAEVVMQEAKHLGLPVLPVDVNCSGDRYRVEYLPAGPALRQGLLQVRAMSAAALRSLLEARQEGAFTCLEDFCARARGVPMPLVENLINCGAMDALGEKRRLLWELQAIARRPRRGTGEQLSMFSAQELSAPAPPLPPHNLREEVSLQLGLLGMSTRCHPLYFRRQQLARWRITPGRALPELPHGRQVRVAGIVIARQRPPTRSGQTVVFITLEDESGLIEVTVFPRIYQRFGRVIFSSPALVVEGTLQKQDRYGVAVVASRLRALSL